jgi:hypothetical protein
MHGAVSVLSLDAHAPQLLLTTLSEKQKRALGQQERVGQHETTQSQARLLVFTKSVSKSLELLTRGLDLGSTVLVQTGNARAYRTPHRSKLLGSRVDSVDSVSASVFGLWCFVRGRLIW